MTTQEEILAAAADVGKMWREDWKIYLEEVSRLCSMSLQEAMLFDLLLTWRRIGEVQGKSLKTIEQHMKDEHGPEDWQKP